MVEDQCDWFEVFQSPIGATLHVKETRCSVHRDGVDVSIPRRGDPPREVGLGENAVIVELGFNPP